MTIQDRTPPADRLLAELWETERELHQIELALEQARRAACAARAAYLAYVDGRTS